MAQMNKNMTKQLIKEGDPRILGKGAIFDQYPYYGDVKNLYNDYMAGKKIKKGRITEEDIDLDVIDNK